MIEYKFINGGEAVDLLNPLIEQRNTEEGGAPWALLNDRTAFAVVAMEGDFVVGYLVLQLLPTLGPEWVAPFQRNGEVSRALVEHMHEQLKTLTARGCLVICESAATEKMCRVAGMKRVELPVYWTNQV
jgi:hypothetical protein